MAVVVAHQRQIQHRQEPVLGCPLVIGIARRSLIRERHGEVDGLVACLCGHHEGVDEGGEGQEPAEDGDEAPEVEEW